MKEEITFTAKQVGERVKERRTELNLTMPELGKRVGVNKSTIQRYEADGVDPKRTMIINGLAEALLTTPEWLTGLSEEKEYDSRTLCSKEMELPVEDMKRFLDGILHIYDEGRTKVSMGDLFGIVAEAEARLTKKENTVAP